MIDPIDQSSNGNRFYSKLENIDIVFELMVLNFVAQCINFVIT